MNPTVAACPTSVRKDFSPVRRAFALAATAGLLAVASQLPAAAAEPVLPRTSEGATTANVEVGSAISLTGVSNAFTLRGLPGATVETADAVDYAVSTNNAAGFTVTVQAANDELTPAGATNPDRIPIADLSVRAAGSGVYTPLSDQHTVTVQRESTRSNEGGDEYTDDYQVHIPFVNSDSYSVALNYVATAS